MGGVDVNMIPDDISDIDLLTALCMGEAEAEPLLGKIAVAQVVYHRTQDPRWPDGWREVMLQPYQFSCFLAEYLRPEIFMHRWSSIHWRECKLAAFGVFNRYVRDIVCGANHYHATWLKKKPSWATAGNAVAEIGDHVFYRL